MKFFFDDQIFKLQRFGGISRYFTEVIFHINQGTKHQAICPFVKTENFHYLERIGHKVSFMHKLQRLITLRFSKKRSDRYFARANKKSIDQALLRKDFDLFVPTYYDPYFLPYLEEKPFVLTVYDMIHEIFPALFVKEDKTIARKALLIEKANHIIAISESTKNDILKFYPNTPASKISVVYLSQSLHQSENIDLELPEKYLLFVGNRGAYKNFDFFFKAIAETLSLNPDLHLVCAGGNAFNADETALIMSYGLTSQVIQRNFKDSELASYYINAICFVFPSKYEGFGIPVLEAMSCGCPVVLANHSSFPEVAGEAGVYFELDQPEDLNAKISSLIFNQELRQAYANKGLEQTKKFSWEKTSEECLAIFKSIANI
jgi:glycosyltransferase involved in cell wall biosynthesis